MDALQGAIDVDTNIFFSINRMHNMYFDYFMSAYSGKWVWIPMYAAIWYVMLRNFHWKVTLFCMIGLALTITFADQACATWIRPYVERMRPSNLNNPISEIAYRQQSSWRALWFSFVSCRQYLRIGVFPVLSIPQAVAYSFHYGLGVADVLFARISRCALSG